MSDRIHIKVYEEILSGKLSPTLPRFNMTTDPVKLVKEANTLKLAIVSSKIGISEVLEDSDYTSLGYKTPIDYDFHVRNIDGGRSEISIFPTTVYELMEIIDIPQFISSKSNAFGILITDQFERIKIRAEKMLEMDINSETAMLYAARNIQKAKKLFHDAKILLKHLQAKQDGEDFYIIFVLSIFLVRTILFYQKMFRPFIQGKPDTETQLKAELYDCISLRHLSRMYKLTDSDYCEFLKKSHAEKSGVCEQEASEYRANDEETFLQKKSHVVESDTPHYPKIQWNGQINVLVDVLLQMKEEHKVSGKPLLGASYETLKNFLVANFCDKHGNDLSPHTIRTILQPQRTDKRLHPESAKRIDISKIINPE